MFGAWLDSSKERKEDEEKKKDCQVKGAASFRSSQRGSSLKSIGGAVGTDWKRLTRGRGSWQSWSRVVGEGHQQQDDVRTMTRKKDPRRSQQEGEETWREEGRR